MMRDKLYDDKSIKVCTDKAIKEGGKTEDLFALTLEHLVKQHGKKVAHKRLWAFLIENIYKWEY